MTNEQICQAILAVEKSDIKSMFDNLENQDKETYKLCFNLESLQLYFCESPNSKYTSNNDFLLCVLTKKEILDLTLKEIILRKIQKEFGACDENKI